MQLSTLKKWSKLFLGLFLLSACSGTRLSIQTDYLTDENLASYYVNTPDPLLNCGAVGQRMIISWRFPKNTYEDVYLHIQIRYKNREEKAIYIDKLHWTGTRIIPLLNDEYFNTGGILTFKAELIADNCVLKEWVHQLWAEVITLEP